MDEKKKRNCVFWFGATKQCCVLLCILLEIPTSNTNNDDLKIEKRTRKGDREREEKVTLYKTWYRISQML